MNAITQTADPATRGSIWALPWVLLRVAFSRPTVLPADQAPRVTVTLY
jgi:hypothetical protein